MAVVTIKRLPATQQCTGSKSTKKVMIMLNLTPEKRRHHLRTRRLDKARKKASRKSWWRDWKRGWKQEFSNEKLDRTILPTSKLDRFIFPTQAILVEKSRNATIGMDVFVEFDKHGNIERVIGVDDNIDYTYLLDNPEYGASLIEPRTGHIIANSRFVEPRTGRVIFISWTIRIFKVFVLFIVSEAISPILWAYNLYKSLDESDPDESDFIGFLRFSWEFLKVVWYPIFIAYDIIMDCRDIQANTSWWYLFKRLFK